MEPTRRKRRRNRRRVPSDVFRQRRQPSDLPSLDGILRSRVALSGHAAERLTERYQQATAVPWCDEQIVRLLRAGAVVGSQSRGRVLVAIDQSNADGGLVCVLTRNVGGGWVVLTVLHSDYVLARRPGR